MTLTFNILMGGAPHGSSLQSGAGPWPMVATGNFSDAWLYLTAPIVGAIVAAILHTGLSRNRPRGRGRRPGGAGPARDARRMSSLRPSLQGLSKN